MKKFLYWLPRLLSILFIVFISIFALDVFDQPQWFLALIMHLIPSFILSILTIIAWKNEQLGGLIFIIIGLFLLISSRFESLIISTPVVIIGILFFIRKYLLNQKD
ncbi:MAG: hypothetical protein WC895_02850 [Candidatus Shapirobacteria bacterium]|jgi:hypothetical protein